jgi:hypothetical protein
MHMATPPGITQWIPLPYGFLKRVRDPLDYQLRARERFGDVFRARMEPTLVHFLYQGAPEAVSSLQDWCGMRIMRVPACRASL